MKKYNKVLSRLYYSSERPASFSGTAKLYYHAKQMEPSISLKIVKEWLGQQHTHQLHRSQTKSKFARRKVVVPGPNYQWDVDLMFVRKIKSQNSGYSYLLIAVDVFSRMAYVQPLKNKTANQTLEAFKRMHANVPGLKVVRSDYGTEFRGVFDKYLTSTGI